MAQDSRAKVSGSRQSANDPWTVDEYPPASAISGMFAPPNPATAFNSRLMTNAKIATTIMSSLLIAHSPESFTVIQAADRHSILPLSSEGYIIIPPVLSGTLHSMKPM